MVAPLAKLLAPFAKILAGSLIRVVLQLVMIGALVAAIYFALGANFDLSLWDMIL